MRVTPLHQFIALSTGSASVWHCLLSSAIHLSPLARQCFQNQIILHLQSCAVAPKAQPSSGEWIRGSSESRLHSLKPDPYSAALVNSSPDYVSRTTKPRNFATPVQRKGHSCLEGNVWDGSISGSFRACVLIPNNTRLDKAGQIRRLDNLIMTEERRKQFYCSKDRCFLSVITKGEPWPL